MNINTHISKFRAANDPHPIDEISLMRFFSAVQQCEYAREISAIRSAIDPDTKKLLKKRLPSVTISGTFTHRSIEGLIKHSGFICLDFDTKGNPGVKNWGDARNDIGGIKEVAFSSLSASGNGCFAVIPLAYPNQHEKQFEALKRDLPMLGYNVDIGCGDIPRLRFISSDPDAIINSYAEPYDRVYTPQPTKYPKSLNGHQTGENEIYRRARVWTDKQITFASGDRHNYIKKLTGVMHRFGASEAYTLQKCLEFEQDGFEAEEIIDIVKAMYIKTQWFNTGK